MTNELVVVEKIEKRLRTPREETIFPLASNHRKELRQLRDSNIGGLRQRLNSLRVLKREEFIKNNKEKQVKELEKLQANVEKLNNTWEPTLKSINKILSERREFEKKYNNKHFRIDNSYGNVGNIEHLSKERNYRTFKLNIKSVSEEITREMFNKKYSKPFDEVNKIIDKMETQYEEAINFGDLELVRQLYYQLKDSEKLFENISNMKV